MLIIGHRGAYGYFTGNTLPSIKLALANNIKAIEIDIRLSKDNELILYHDEKIIYNNKNIFVSNIFFKDLKNIGVNSLKEFLDYYISLDTNILIFFEIKKSISYNNEIIEKLVNIFNIYIKKGLKLDNFYIQSFHAQYIKDIVNYIPFKNYGLIYYGLPLNEYSDINNLKCSFVSISIDSYCKEFVKNMNKKNIKVFVYTINDLNYIKLLEQDNISGYFTDYC